MHEAEVAAARPDVAARRTRVARRVAAALLVAATLLIGGFVLVLSVWGAAAACLEGSSGWRCSGTGLDLITAVVPVAGVAGLVCAFWSLALSRSPSSRPDTLLVTGYLVIIASWLTSLALALS